MSSVIGWDIGGAHLKAARAENGEVTDVLQLPCPLWLGLDRLTDAIGAASARLGPAERHVATMTGELADIFPDRAQGVAHITGALAAAVGEARLMLYAGRAGLVPCSAAHAFAADIASANWHATAAGVARSVPDGLFVDIGSTTTDLVPLSGGEVRARGRTDFERLSAGELVYTGLTRTPVMALATRAPLDGVWVTLAAELFATSADVYRILGELPDDADQMPAADGREKTFAASCARLARMVGRDSASADDGVWRALAAWFAEAQLRQIMDAAMLVLSAVPLPPEAPVVTAGAGHHVATRLALLLRHPSVGFADLLRRVAGVRPLDEATVLQCAPAIAVAML